MSNLDEIAYTLRAAFNTLRFTRLWDRLPPGQRDDIYALIELEMQNRRTWTFTDPPPRIIGLC